MMQQSKDEKYINDLVSIANVFTSVAEIVPLKIKFSNKFEINLK